jgi:hypothetical protein
VDGDRRTNDLARQRLKLMHVGWFRAFVVSCFVVVVLSSLVKWRNRRFPRTNTPHQHSKLCAVLIDLIEPDQDVSRLASIWRS